jgi:hypothetical protein
MRKGLTATDKDNALDIREFELANEHSTDHF